MTEKQLKGVIERYIKARIAYFCDEEGDEKIIERLSTAKMKMNKAIHGLFHKDISLQEAMRADGRHSD